MRKNSKRSISVLSSVLMLALLLAGCKSGAAPTSAAAPASSASSSSASAAEKKIKLVVWSTPKWKGVFDSAEAGADYDSFFKEAGRRYAEAHPNVTVSVEIIPGDSRDEKLNIALKSGTLPDIMFESTFTLSSFVYKNAIIPLDDVISAEDRAAIPEGMWENCTAEGKVFCFPFSHQPGTLIYNAKMFREAGLDQYIAGEYDIASWTPDELKTILETLKAKLPNVYPMSLYAKNNQGDTWTLAYLRMFGNPFFEESGKLTINQESGVKALQFLLDLNKAGLTVPGAESLSSNDCNAMFINGQVAVSFTNNILMGTQWAEMRAADPAADIRLANIPGEPNPLTFTYVTGGMAMNTGDADRMAAAKDFIRFFSSDPELTLASKNGLPIRAAVADQLKEEMPYLAAHNKNARNLFDFSRNIAGYTELRNALFPELQAALIGEKTAQQALDGYAEKGDAIISEARANAVSFS